jgi:hypothetical protein
VAKGQKTAGAFSVLEQACPDASCSLDFQNPYPLQVRAFPRESWSTLGHRPIHHGRAVCRAVKPDCGGCVLQRQCPKLGV